MKRGWLAGLLVLASMLALSVPALSRPSDLTITPPFPPSREDSSVTILTPGDGETVSDVLTSSGEARSAGGIGGVALFVRSSNGLGYWNPETGAWQRRFVTFDADLEMTDDDRASWSLDIALDAFPEGAYRLTAMLRSPFGWYVLSARDQHAFEVEANVPSPPTTVQPPSTTTTEAPITTTTEAPITTTTEAPTTPTTQAPTTTTTEAPTTTTEAPPPPPGEQYQSCSYPAAADVRTADFRAMRASGVDVGLLNDGRLDGAPTFIRSVFDLDAERMQWGDEGLELTFDVGIPGPLDYRSRSELRETAINVPIPAGTTQAYCMRFTVEDLPDLYGPVTIFQRFNRDNDGPDIEVELTGANQFSNAVPNDLQVVAFDGRHRIGTQLERVNTLLVVVYNHRSDGAYKVILNGRVLRQGSNLDTVGSTAGGWSQFGLYPHGLHSGENRQDQISSGRTSMRFEYADFALANVDQGSGDLGEFGMGSGG